MESASAEAGGAGALTAKNKYGYPAKAEMRSVDAACTAVEEGCKVVGLGFLDVEELGERLVEDLPQSSRGSNLC